MAATDQPRYAESKVCDRCGSRFAVIVQTFCAECGPTPLCPECTTAHKIEVDQWGVPT